MEGLRSYLKDTLGISAVLGEELRPLDLLVVLDTEFQALSAKHSELLTRILEAGLKVSMSRVHWVTLTKGSDLPEFLNNAIGQSLALGIPVLVFGEAWDPAVQRQCHFGEVFEVQGAQILVTHGLQEICESERVKREAWTHLQKLKGRIPKG